MTKSRASSSQSNTQTSKSKKPSTASGNGSRGSSKKSKPKSHKTVKVPGHWVYPLGFRKDGAPKKGYYVKPYKYQRKTVKNKKHLPIRVYPGKRVPPAPPGYVLDRHYDFKEVEERVVYTFKIECLVEYQGRYTMAFSLDKDLVGQKAIEYYHTKFEPTPEAAKEDFREQIALLKAYGHVIDYLAVDLYRVSGEGPMREKHWELVKRYYTPERVK